MNNNYKGNRWYKCDLHIHTPASKCFEDKSITPQQFIDRVIENNIKSEKLAKIDYIEIVDSNSLEEVKEISKSILVAIAVFIGKTRLIDNFTYEL